MTIHIKYSHQCPKCSEEYIPFSEEQRPCPKCGTPAERVETLVPEIVRAARYNVRYGVFGIFSLGDWYVKKAMHVIWTIAEQGMTLPNNDESLDSLCNELLKFFDFGECTYRIPHMKAFIREVIAEAYLKRERRVSGSG